MSNLVRRDHVFDDLFDLRRNFDHMISRFFGGAAAMPERQPRMLVAVPPIEAWIDNEDKKYHLSIAVPGIDPKEVEVNLQGNHLTVSGEHKSENEKKEADYLHQEFIYGRLERTVALPEGVDTSKLTAEYNNGVLEISAPLSASALPKKIEVKTATKAKGATA